MLGHCLHISGLPGKNTHRTSHATEVSSRKIGSEPPSGYYLYAGKWDLTRPSTLRFHKWLNRKGYSHSYTKYPGSHDWPDGWTQEFKDMFQKLFK